MSVYRTIGPLVLSSPELKAQKVSLKDGHAPSSLSFTLFKDLL